MNPHNNPIAKAIENATNAVTGFVHGYFSTAWHLAIHPSKLDALFQPEEKEILIPPLPFLISSCLLFALTLHYALTGPLEFGADQFFRYFAREASDNASISVVMLRTVPAAILTILVAHLLVRFVLAKPKDSKGITLALTYITALGFLTAFMLVSLKGVVDLALDREIEPGILRPLGAKEKLITATILATGSCGLLLGWIAASVNVARVTVRNSRPQWGLVKKTAAAAFLATTMNAVIIPNSAIVAAGDLMSGVHKGIPRPVRIEVVEYEFTPVNGQMAVRIKAYIENRGRQVISIIQTPDRDNPAIALEWPDPSTIVEEVSEVNRAQPPRTDPIPATTAYSLRQIPLTFFNSPSGKSPYVSIPPSSRSWIEVTGTCSKTEYENLLSAIQSAVAKKEIQLKVSLVRGEGFGRPSSWAAGHFIPTL